MIHETSSDNNNSSVPRRRHQSELACHDVIVLSPSASLVVSTRFLAVLRAVFATTTVVVVVVAVVIVIALLAPCQARSRNAQIFPPRKLQHNYSSFQDDSAYDPEYSLDEEEGCDKAEFSFDLGLSSTSGFALSDNDLNWISSDNMAEEERILSALERRDQEDHGGCTNVEDYHLSSEGQGRRAAIKPPKASPPYRAIGKHIPNKESTTQKKIGLTNNNNGPRNTRETSKKNKKRETQQQGFNRSNQLSKLEPRPMTSQSIDTVHLPSEYIFRLPRSILDPSASQKTTNPQEQLPNSEPSNVNQPNTFHHDTEERQGILEKPQSSQKTWHEFNKLDLPADPTEPRPQQQSHALPSRSSSSNSKTPTVVPPPVAGPWVQRFLTRSLAKQEMLLLVPLDFLMDNFNLAQLAPVVEQTVCDHFGRPSPSEDYSSSHGSFPLYRRALQLITSQDPPPQQQVWNVYQHSQHVINAGHALSSGGGGASASGDADNEVVAADPLESEAIEMAAVLLYCLVHQRYVLSPRGLEALRRRFLLSATRGNSYNSLVTTTNKEELDVVNPLFGRCPNPSCHGMPLLPAGHDDYLPLSAADNQKYMFRYCGRCQQYWAHWSDTKTSSTSIPLRSDRYLQGCAWGSSLGPLFHLSFPGFLRPCVRESKELELSLLPPPPPQEPRIFGFRLHPSAHVYPCNKSRNVTL